jgi:hypothetical protein
MRQVEHEIVSISRIIGFFLVGQALLAGAFACQAAFWQTFSATC